MTSRRTSMARRCVVRSWLLAGVLASAGGVASTTAQDGATRASAEQAEPAHRSCTLVFGHGRNHVVDMPEANAIWNDLNRRFATAVARTLAQVGWRTEVMVLPVESRDMMANLAQLLDRIGVQGCDRLLEATVLGEPGSELVIIRLRLHRITRQPGPPRLDGAQAIGPVEITVQRDMPLNQRTVARLGADDLAQQLAAELLVRLNP